MDNYNIIDVNRQAILQRLQERMQYKEKLLPYIIKIYDGEYDKKYKIKTNSIGKKQNFIDCATDIWIEKETGQITGANFCKQRLCPVCNYRRSTMLWHKVKEVTNLIKNEYIFITLTIKNCKAEELNENINNILESFHRITSRRTWKKNFIGYIRGLEITYNAEQDTYHPHLHILAVASENYFKSEYVDIHTLRQWWTASANLDYYVQVNIKKVKDKNKAIAEVVKYAVKMADILEQGIDEKRLKATQTLASCIAGRRLMSTAGIISKTAKQLKINFDDDEMDIIEKREKSKRFHYENGLYFEKEN